MGGLSTGSYQVTRVRPPSCLWPPRRSTNHYKDSIVGLDLSQTSSGWPVLHHHCLDWTLVWSAQHLHRVLSEYVRHYNAARPHRGIALQVPVLAPAPVAVDEHAALERVDVLGGLIHEYRYAA
jgi:hypothetical protein